MAARPASESYRERSGTSQEADTRPDRRPLTFSFWTAMFGKEYETLWQTTLHRSGRHPDGQGLRIGICAYGADLRLAAVLGTTRWKH